MSTANRWNLLYIKDDQSLFDSETKAFKTLFEKVDIVQGTEETVSLFTANTYDIVLGDLSVRPETVALLKQIKDLKTEQTIFALVSPRDSDKLFGIADLGIHAFELLPEQFDLALEEISKFNPYST